MGEEATKEYFIKFLGEQCVTKDGKSTFPDCSKTGLDWLYKHFNTCHGFADGEFKYELRIDKFPTNYSCMEIDIWCEKNKIGCEYDGPHH